MRWIIDRFEGDYAVVECGNLHFNIPKEALGETASEGDVLNVSVDASATEDKKSQLQGRLKKLFGE